MKSVEEFISKELHSLLFLEEFVFAQNKFSPPSASELELADAVVLLGDVLLIYQIKERSAQHAGNEEAERSWFKEQVLKKATKQIRDTLGYLSAHESIKIPNERGRFFDLASRKYAQIIKVIIYRPSKSLPADCRETQNYVSKTAGFIHIIDAADYLEIGKLLRVPQEVVRYFDYREAVLKRLHETGQSIADAAIAGQFIGGDQQSLPTIESVGFLYDIVNDEKEWDLAPLLRNLHNHLSDPNYADDYYEILIEFAKLPRSMWRVIKERIVLCINKVKSDTFTQPYRVASRDTDCGFIFIPVHSDLSQHADWKDVRLNGLLKYMHAHKYDQKLAKCVGVLVSKDGEYFEIFWALMSYPWVEDAEISALCEDAPFRPVSEKPVQGYRFVLDS